MSEKNYSESRSGTYEVMLPRQVMQSLESRDQSAVRGYFERGHAGLDAIEDLIAEGEE